MEELVEKLADKPELELKRNAGRFAPHDTRINRDGRPRGSAKAAAQEVSRLVDRAPCADRLMLLLLRTREIAYHLTNGSAFWVTNLPSDSEIVSCRVDDDRDAVLFVIRSDSFPRIARGALIPEFNPRFNGLRWKVTRDGPKVPAKA